MLSPLEKKRATYLSFFKDGVADGLLSGIIDDSKRSSAYYKQGYDFGLVMYAKSRLDIVVEMEREMIINKRDDMMPNWAEAMLEVEGLINEEVSKLTKKGEHKIAKILVNSLKVIKRGY